MRHYLMELIGAFFLTMAFAFTRDAMTTGLILIALVYIGANISGAHYNPGVTLAAMLRKKMSFNDGLFYMGAQVIGATIAGLLYTRIIGEVFVIANGQQDMLIGFVMEALIAALFVMVFMTAFGKDMKGNMEYGLIIGFAFAGLVGLGALVNPAFAAGSILCNVIQSGPVKDNATIILYIVAPLTGALLAVYTQRYLTGEK